MADLQSSLDFDNEVYLTETMPSVFADAQEAATKVFTEAGGLVTTLQSRTKRALLTWLSQAPSLKLWEGERQIKRQSSNEFTVAAKKYELTIGIDEDDLEDAAEVDSLANEIANAGEASAQHPDQVIWDFLDTQGETAIGYDNVPLLSAVHPLKNGNTYSNLIGGGGSPWYLLDTRNRAKGLIWMVRKEYDLEVKLASQSETGFMTGKHLFGIKARVEVAPGVPNRILKSSAVLDDTSFKAAFTQMREYKGDAGRPIVVMPTVLMVAPSNEFAARDILNRTLIGGGNSNVIQNMVQIVVNPYLP